MAQRRRMENPGVHMSNDGALDFFFHKAAGEFTKLYALALDREVAFNAGTSYAYMRVYEWIQLQLQDGKSITAADMSAYLQDELNQMDGNMLVMQQEVGQSANKVQLEDNTLNTQQLPRQLAHESHSGASGDTNGNASASQHAANYGACEVQVVENKLYNRGSLTNGSLV